MKKLLAILIFALLSLPALGQASWYGSVAQGGAYINGIQVEQPLGGASLLVCTTVATCDLSHLATIYTTSAATVTVDQTNFPVVADNQGNFGFWALPGTYQYSFTYKGATYGPYTVTIGPDVTGAFSVKTLNKVRYADQFATIQLAITDAGTTGSVVIPPSYIGTDSYNNPNGIQVTDLRSGGLGLFGPNSAALLRSSRPTKDLTSNVMPLGGDILIESDGAADIHLRTGNNGNGASTTSTTSVTGGGGAQAITVGSTSNFYALGGLILDQYTANEEVLNSPNYSITDGAHLSVTPIKSHTQPFNVTQAGAIRVDSWQFCGYDLDNVNPTYCMRNIGTGTGLNRNFDIHHGSSGQVYFRSGISGDHIPRWYGANGGPLILFGSNGAAGSNGLIYFSKNDSDDPNGTNSIVRIDPSNGVLYTNFISSRTSANPAATGNIRLSSPDTACWRNNANSADVCISKSVADVLNLGGAAGVAIPGLVASYNGVTTVGSGIPYQTGRTDLTAQAANITAQTLYTPAVTGLYRVSVSIIVTQSATTSSTLPSVVLAWTDGDNSTVQSFTMTATNAGNTLTTYATGTAIINAKLSTAITWTSTGYLSSGATPMQYAVHVRAEAL